MDYECLICQKTATVSMKIEDVIEFYEKAQKDIQHSKEEKRDSELKCESCEEKIATLCCIDCNNQIYCEGCLNAIHQLNKKFANHKINSLEEKKKVTEKTEFRSNIICKCQANKIL